ncbi:MAG: sugar kinase [Candidatus Brocadiae bacterium]|nr:sugar kinase [Candidatus Brocadiia bacterium]
MAAELISIGLAVVDHLWLCDEPVVGTFGPASDYLVQGGGLAATAAVAMARLGGRVEMWTVVGSDEAGRFILDQFQREGVDTSQVQVCPDGRSPVCAVTVDRTEGERYFRYFRGRGLDGSVEALDLGRIASAKAILVDGWWPEAQLLAARRARELGVPVCGDYEGLSDTFLDLVRHTDYPIYSAECAARHGGTGDIEGDLRKVADLGGRVPMITLGDQGCIWLEDGEVGRCPAFAVDVVDTTGCGDVFHGAFTFGLARGWDVARNARFASAVAALKCRALGGRTGIPTCDEVEAFLAERA